MPISPQMQSFSLGDLLAMINGNVQQQQPQQVQPPLANSAGAIGATSAINLPGANENQIQGGAQVGQFSSTGAQAQQQESGSEATGQSLGQTTTGVNDTLGMGSLLQGQQPMAANTTADTNAYLSDVMKTGGSGFQGNVDQAVRQAVSGPGMAGLGDNATSRAAGNAAAQVALQNQGQRLQAAGQLSGPTAATTLAGAGTPFLGQTQTTAGANSQSQTGMSKLLNAQGSSGTSSANSMQQGYGVVPQQSSSGGGGGSVICTALGERGMLPRWMLEAEVVYVKANWSKLKTAAKGYLLWGVPVAKLVRRSKLVAYMCLPFAEACAYEASRRSKATLLELPLDLTSVAAYYAFLIPNYILGLFVRGKATVKDPEINKMLVDSGLNLGEL